MEFLTNLWNNQPNVVIGVGMATADFNVDRLSIVNKYRVEGNKLQNPILLNGDFLAFSLFFRKYAYIGFNLL